MGTGSNCLELGSPGQGTPPNPWWQWVWDDWAASIREPPAEVELRRQVARIPSSSMASPSSRVGQLGGPGWQTPSNSRSAPARNSGEYPAAVGAAVAKRTPLGNQGQQGDSKVESSGRAGHPRERSLGAGQLGGEH